MGYRMDLYCANTDVCAEKLTIDIESEDMGDGGEHMVKCDSCGKTTIFNLAYEPVTDDERLLIDD